MLTDFPNVISTAPMTLSDSLSTKSHCTKVRKQVAVKLGGLWDTTQG